MFSQKSVWTSSSCHERKQNSITLYVRREMSTDPGEHEYFKRATPDP